MSHKFEDYFALRREIPLKTQVWNMYGAGVENIGRDGAPETESIPEPNANQLLVRVDAVGMCFSDVKLIKQGGAHPKLYNRDLAVNPTRLGHEATVTIIKVGEALQDKYHPGDRFAIQPDIYQNGKSTAYGYTIPGGLTQYHLIGPEVLAADGVNYTIPVKEDTGYAEMALTEPWACVFAAYTQRRRLSPKSGGVMWIVGQKGDATPYTFSAELDAPAKIYLSDVPDGLKDLLRAETATHGTTIIEKNGLTSADYPAFNESETGGAGFDDIVLLNPQSAEMVGAAAKLIARRGTLNLVGNTPLNADVSVDVGRMHYDYTTYIGNAGTDISASYGEARNRCDLRSGGTAIFVGAGGPMGQMHVQRALEMADGPTQVIATDINSPRLAALENKYAALAESREKRLLTFNPNESDRTLHEFVMAATQNAGADDVIVSVPVAAVMAEAATLMKDDGMLVFFAGVPNGTFAPLNLSNVYLHNAQFTGTSGSRVEDQAQVIQMAETHQLSPNRSVAAIGGIEAAQEGVAAMMEGRYPGKVVIFPQLNGLPLTGVAELPEQFPEIAKYLAPGNVWTAEAEKALFERFLPDDIHAHAKSGH